MGWKEEAQVKLEATTSVEPARALLLVRRVADEIRAPAASFSLGRFEVGAGQRVVVEAGDDSRLSLEITNMKVARFCTFSAEVRAIDGVTTLRVGPLESFKTSQGTFLFIPMGPKLLVGFPLYKQFLEAVADELRALDGASQIRIGSAG
jgi:hypothetical protein